MKNGSSGLSVLHWKSGHTVLL